MKNLELDILKKINKVEAPPFLFTRVLERVREYKKEEFSPPLAWALNISVISLLVFSTVIGINFYKSEKSKVGLSTFVQTQNRLYND